MLTGRYRYRVATAGALWWKRQVVILQLEEKSRYYEPMDCDGIGGGDSYDVLEWRDAKPEEMMVDNWNEPDLRHQQVRMHPDQGRVQPLDGRA